MWRELLLQYCIHSNLHNLIPSTFPYFKNATLGRELNHEGIQAVIAYIIKSGRTLFDHAYHKHWTRICLTVNFAGNAEWEDSNQSSLRIIWKTPEALAGEVYHWAIHQEVVGTVFTLYELHSGEENQDSGTVNGWRHSANRCYQCVTHYAYRHSRSVSFAGFHGCDPVILRRALELLQSSNKVILAPASECCSFLTHGSLFCLTHGSLYCC